MYSISYTSENRKSRNVVNSWGIMTSNIKKGFMKRMGSNNARKGKKHCICVFDTETTGLAPKNTEATAESVSSGAWDGARLLQLAWAIYEPTTRALIEKRDLYVRPDGFVISEGAQGVHGITMEIATEKGRSIREVLDEFTQSLDKHSVGTLVAHNIGFDVAIIKSELLRMEIPPKDIDKMQQICTMRLAKRKLQLQKWPKLGALHEQLFGETFANAHNAAADVDACARAYFRLEDM